MVVLHSKASARLQSIKKLQVERDMERMDKIWILDKYAIVFGKTQTAGKARDPNLPENIKALGDTHLAPNNGSKPQPKRVSGSDMPIQVSPPMANSAKNKNNLSSAKV
jgi:hypothetical protein